jgi:hypothetical protein
MGIKRAASEGVFPSRPVTAMSGASLGLGGGLSFPRSSSAGGLFMSVEERIDSMWALGGKQAKLREKRPYSHGLAQFYNAPFDVAYGKIAQERNLRLLETLFNQADDDGSGMISVEEFSHSLNDDTIRETFSRLGIQPHQSELVFKAVDANKTGEVPISQFIDGLYAVVGGLDLNAEANELDVSRIKVASPNKMKRETPPAEKHMAPRSSNPTLGVPTGSYSSRRSSILQADPGRAGRVLPNISNVVSGDKLHRAFVHSALAKALLPATCKPKISHRGR